MKSGEMLGAFFEFHQAMNERLWVILMAHVSDDQFIEDPGYSQGSIRSQIVHMAEAAYYWLSALGIAADVPKLNAEDFPTREAARAACQQADQEILSRVRGLSEADLERVPDGWSQPVWVGLAQNANHSTDHRAQILRALHDMGAPTFDQAFADYMEYATPMTVEGLIGEIGKAWAKWDDAVGQVKDDQIDREVMGDWTVRDLIAIVTWKEGKVIEMIRDRAYTGVSFGELEKAEQASLLIASRALPLAELKERHQATHREMVESVRTLSDDDLNSDEFHGLEPDMRFWKMIAAGSWWGYGGLGGRIRQLIS